MTKSCYYIYVMAVATSAMAGSAFSQEKNPSVAHSDPDSLLRAKRVMRTVDKNGNGTFEKSEDAAAWRRYRKLDANRDGVLSIDELREQQSAYLVTRGERKLNIVYKRVGERDFPLMHAYYMKQRADAVKAPVEIMIIKNAGHNWRKVDAEIYPSREAIIERTVKFFVDHL